MREVNFQGLQEGPLFLQLRLELNRFQNHTVQVMLGSGCEDIVPCRGAQGLGLTPACHSRALQYSLCAPWAWGKDHPSPMGSMLSFPSLDPCSDVILGSAGWDSQKPKKALCARMNCSPLGKPSERDPVEVEVPPVETVIAPSFVGHFGHVLIHF